MNCLFCHTRPAGALTKEHVLSRPICDVFEIDRDGQLMGRFDASVQKLSSVARLGSLAVRAVCGECNNGWMSTMEATVARIFSRWLGGAALTPDERRLIQRWQAKTHLVLCRVEGGARRDPASAVLPDATLARRVFHDEEDAFVSTRTGVARSGQRNSILYAFGTPAIRAAGPGQIGRGVASVSVLLLGPLQFWTLNTILPLVRASGVRLPDTVAPIEPGLTTADLPIAGPKPNLQSAVIDFAPLSPAQMSALLDEMAVGTGD